MASIELHAMISGFDFVANACRESAKYPQTLGYTISSREALERQTDSIKKQECRLFSLTTTNFEVHELQAGMGEYATLKNPSEEVFRKHLSRHYIGKMKDPVVRHIFISAAHSRAPLGLTMKMFQLLGSYHQVPPCFFDAIQSFGSPQHPPRTLYSAGLLEDDQPKTFPQPSQDIPELGRSGWQLRHCYQIQAMERSDVDVAKDGKTMKWTRRLAVQCHIFDLVTGRNTCITAMGHNTMRDRILPVLGASVNMRSQCSVSTSVPRPVGDGLFQLLWVQRVTLAWAVEGWSEWVDDKQTRCREFVIKPKATPIPQLDKNTTRIARTFSSRAETVEAAPSDQLPNWYQQLLSIFMSIWETKSSSDANQTSAFVKRPATKDAQSEAEHCKRQISSVMKLLDKLEEFSIDESQGATNILIELQEGILAMELNLKVLRDIPAIYNRLLESNDCPQEIRDHKETIAEFSNQLQNLQRRLEIESARASAVAAQATEGKDLYDAILNFRNTELNKIFALHTQLSSLKMEAVAEGSHDIAQKTESKTASMHIITLFTLIFLPGTFLATFFSTPIFEGPSDTEGWSFDENLFMLFIKICIPMMVFTIVIWAIYVYITRKSTRKRRVRVIQGEKV